MDDNDNGVNGLTMIHFRRMALSGALGYPGIQNEDLGLQRSLQKVWETEWCHLYFTVCTKYTHTFRKYERLCILGHIVISIQ